MGGVSLRALSTVDHVLKKRICDECDRYFGSVNSMNSHKKVCKLRFMQPGENKEVPERIRPIRIAAERLGEYFCALAFHEIEWHNIDNVEDLDLDVPNEYVVKSGTPGFEEVKWMFKNRTKYKVPCYSFILHTL